MTSLDLDAFDKVVRWHIFDHFIKTAKAPTIAEIAAALTSSFAEVQAAFRRLQERHIVVLQQGNGEILMALPFSAVPTTFQVEVGSRAWWGNCIWDALGIPAMLKADARIVTACGDCNDSMILTIKDGLLVEGAGVIHFALPARRWFDNIVFT